MAEQFNQAPVALDTPDKIMEQSEAIAKNEAGLAIIVTGDSCTQAVPAGGYAYIKNNTHGLTEGLYRNKSSSSFPTSGGTANSTVFEAVSDGGLNALNSKITSMDFGYYSVIEGVSLTTSYTEIPTYGSRKFSDYKVIEILASKDNWVFLVGVIPTSSFPNRTGVACFISPGIEVDVKYKSDTSVEAKYISSNTVSIVLQIFAIK